MRVVLDTNILISAILSPGSTADRALRYGGSGEVELAFSPQTIEEAWRVLHSSKITALLNQRGALLPKVEEFLRTLFESSFLTEGKLSVEVIRDDPDDDNFLACAVEAQADLIVSGDHHLTSLKSFHGIQIVTPQVFLKLMERLSEE